MLLKHCLPWLTMPAEQRTGEFPYLLNRSSTWILAIKNKQHKFYFGINPQSYRTNSRQKHSCAAILEGDWITFSKPKYQNTGMDEWNFNTYLMFLMNRAFPRRPSSLRAKLGLVNKDPIAHYSSLFRASIYNFSGRYKAKLDACQSLLQEPRTFFHCASKRSDWLLHSLASFPFLSLQVKSKQTTGLLSLCLKSKQPYNEASGTEEENESEIGEENEDRVLLPLQNGRYTTESEFEISLVIDEVEAK